MARILGWIGHSLFLLWALVFSSSITAQVIDRDQDGFADDIDNCLNVSNPDQLDSGGINTNTPDGIGNACQCGDVNNSGKVDNTDAILIKRHLLGLPPGINLEKCNVNNGSVCDNTDAIFIQRAILGLPPGISQTCAVAVEVPDIDSDGIVDGSDNCPNTPNADQINTDGDEFGDVCDVDIDGDGISNEDDLDPFDPAVGVCTSTRTIAATDGLSAPVIANVGEWVLYPELSDEFDGTEVDTSKWSFQNGTGCPDLCGWGNNELQSYQANNATVAGGILTIAGKEETVGGNSYTSARMRTIDKIDVTYGRIEARIKVPPGKGLWPAFWMLPTDSPYGDSWAATGEIDIFETFNPGVPAIPWSYNRIDGGIWHGMASPNQLHRGAQFNADPMQFHTYAIEWETNEIRWYIDDIHYQTIGADHYRSYYWGGDDTGYVRAAPGAPFDAEFHILLNMAIGGIGPAYLPDGNNIWPADMLVDYVRIYKCMIDGVESETGGGCANNVNPIIESPPAADIFVATENLFTDTVNDLVFCSDTGVLTREMKLVELGTNQVTVSEIEAMADADAYGTVLDIITEYTAGGLDDFAGVALVPEDEGEIKLIGMGERFGASQNADIRMDVYIDSANTDQSGFVIISMNSKDGALGGDFATFAMSDLPQDEWTTISVPLNEFIIGGIDPASVTKLVGISTSRYAHIQMDNLQLVCGSRSINGCGIQAPLPNYGSVLNVFIDEVDPLWTNGIGAWDPYFGNDYSEGDTSNQVRWRMVATGEAGHDSVLEMEFTDGSALGVLFIQSAIPIDLTGFLEGKLVFDIRLIEGDPSPALNVKVDCRDPCSSGPRTLEGISAEWKTFTFTAADLISSGLDIRKVNTGIVIIRNSANAGATFQIDNVRWEKFGDEPPPPPPPEGSQPPTLPTAGSLVLYQNGPGAEDQWLLWDCCGNATVEEVLASDAAHGVAYGSVTQISYGPGGSVSGYSYGGSGDAGITIDVSGYVGGTLEFDALIVSNPTSGAPWILKITSPNDTTQATMQIVEGHGNTIKPIGEWAHYSFSLDGQLSGLDKSKFKFLLVFPEWMWADGGVIQLDNVHIAPPQ